MTLLVSDTVVLDDEISEVFTLLCVAFHDAQKKSFVTCIPKTLTSSASVMDFDSTSLSTWLFHASRIT